MSRFICICLILAILVGICGCGADAPPRPANEPEIRTSDDPGLLINDGGASMEKEPESTEDIKDDQEIDDKPQQEHFDTDEEEQENDDMAPLEKEEEMEVIEKEDPPRFGYIDAHADTITRALLPQHNAGLFRNNLHLDFERMMQFEAPVQVFVLWCADRYVSNAFEYTNSLIDFFEAELERHGDIVELALSLDDMERNARNNKISAILSIEGGEALMGDIDNLKHFYDRGVRMFGLTWNRENELGFGQETGSTKGLKPFGEEVVKELEQLGMIMDVSHINEAGFWDAHKISTRPYIASHSNAFTVTPHKRNLTDDQIIAIVDRGGVIGLALYPTILTQNNRANMRDIMAHVEQFISLGAGESLGLGSDFDGFSTMPTGLTDVLSLKILEEELAGRFGGEVSYGIMSGNFYNFFVRYFRG